MMGIDLDYSKLYLLVKIYAYLVLITGILLPGSATASNQLSVYFRYYYCWACFLDSIYLYRLSFQVKIIIGSIKSNYRRFNFNEGYGVYYTEYCINLIFSFLQVIDYICQEYEDSWIDCIRYLALFWNIVVLLMFPYHYLCIDHSIRNIIGSYLSVLMGLHIIRYCI